MSDQRREVGVPHVSDEVHGRNQDGLRSVREIASAEIDGLQIDPLDLAVAGLEAALMVVIHGAAVDRRDHQGPRLELQGERLPNRLASQRDRRILALRQMQNGRQIDHVFLARHRDDRLARETNPFVAYRSRPSQRFCLVLDHRGSR
jgi:hypothetical protein